MTRKFVIMFKEAYCYVKGHRLEATMKLNIANTYTSRYAAKKHLRTLDNVPLGVRIVELSECSSVG